MKFKRTTAKHQYVHIAMVDGLDEQLPSYLTEKTPVVEEEPAKALLPPRRPSRIMISVLLTILGCLLFL